MVLSLFWRRLVLAFLPLISAAAQSGPPFSITNAPNSPTICPAPSAGPQQACVDSSKPSLLSFTGPAQPVTLQVDFLSTDLSWVGLRVPETVIGGDPGQPFTTFSGTAPFELEITLRAESARLPPGRHTALLRITTGSTTYRVPIHYVSAVDSLPFTASSVLQMTAIAGSPAKSQVNVQYARPTANRLALTSATLDGLPWLSTDLAGDIDPCSQQGAPCNFVVTAWAPDTPGEYQGFIVLRGTEDNRTNFLVVRLNVVPASDTPTGGPLYIEQTNATISCDLGGVSDWAELLVLGGPVDFRYEIPDRPSWLTIDLERPRTPARMRFRANCATLTSSRYAISVSLLEPGATNGLTFTLYLNVRRPSDPLRWLTPWFETTADWKHRVTLANAAADSAAYRLQIPDGTPGGIVLAGAVGGRSLTALEPTPRTDLKAWLQTVAGAETRVTHLVRHVNPTLQSVRETYLPTPTWTAAKLWLPFDDSAGTTVSQISVANPAATAAQCAVSLWSAGRALTFAPLSLGPGRQLSFEASLGTTRTSGVVALDCGTAEVAAAVMRRRDNGNLAGYEAFAARRDGAAVPTALPLLADGAFHRTALLLVNTDAKELPYRVRFRRRDVVAEEEGKIPGGGLVTVNTSGTLAWQTGGTAPVAWAELTASPAVRAAVVISQEANGPNPSETAYTPPAAAKAWLEPFDNTSGFATWFHFTNPTAKNVQVTIRLWGEAAEDLGTATVTVEAGTSLPVRLREERWQNRRGTAVLSADGDLTVAAFRPNGSALAVHVPLVRD